VATNAPIKLNLGGQGWAGGIDYPTVAYRRVLNGQSNIYLYDLSDDTRPSTPAGINTGKNEYRPTISGDWLLFGRDDNNGRVQRIVLHNSSTGNERQIAFARRSRALLLPGQINGAFASYMRCDPVCNVHVYSIVTRSTYILPKPTPATHQYSSAVAPNGAVYVARAGNDCGANVRIVRYLEVGDPREGTVIARLPDRRDIGYMSARQSTDGTVEVFYGRFHCRTDTWDLYKVTDAPGPP
jgi:hypothetical protein